MKLKKLLASCLGVAMAVSMLAGCSSKSDSNGITVNIEDEPTTLNSIKATGSIDGNVLRHCMEGLVTLDEKDNAAPGVVEVLPTVENGGISKDGKTITFKLRKDEKWSNGEPVTAKDFEFAFTALFTRQTGSTYADTWGALVAGAEDLLEATKDIPVQDVATKAKAVYDARGWKAVDDYTFEVKLTNPCTYFVPLMAYMSFYPVNEKFYLEAGDKYATEADQLLYNGAFTISEWQHKNKIVLEKKADYWDADSVKLETITMEMIADTNTVMNRFNEGTMDMIRLTGDQVEQIKKDNPDQKIEKYSDGSSFYLEYNVNVKGLNNPKVRKALTVAVDADTFIKNIMKNSSTVANSMTPSAILNGEFTKKVGNVFDRNSIDAKALLEEGLKEEGMKPSDLKVTLLSDEGDSAQKKCAYVQEQFKKLGVDLKIEQTTFQTRVGRMHDHQFDIVFAAWGPDYNDPMTFLDLWVTNSGNNCGQWSNKKYDSLISKARKEKDPSVRDGYLVEAEKILAEEMPVGYIFHSVRDYVCSDRLVGARRTAFQDLNLKYAEVK